MKGRILIPLVLLLLVMFIGGYFAVSRIFNINQRARDYLTERASEFLGVEFNASSAVIFPWSISIKNAQLTLKNIPVKIEVNRIRISFNLFDLIKNRFKPIYGTEQIYLDRPVFTWILGQNGGKPGTLNLENIPIVSLKDIPFIRININRGSLVLNRGEESFVFAQDFSGWVDGIHPREIYLNGEGKVLSQKTNTTFKGVFNRLEDIYYLDLVSRKCNLARDNIDLISGDICPTAGSLDYTLHLDQKDRKFFISGDYSLHNGSFDLKGYKVGFSNVSITGSISRKEIIFDSISGTVWNVHPELTGKLSLEPDPSLSLNIRASDIELSTLLSDIYPDHETYPSGTINLIATMEGPLRELKTVAELSSGALMYRGNLFSNFNANIQLDKGKMRFERFRARYKNYSLRAQGVSSFNSLAEKKDFSLNLSVQNVSDKSQDYSFQFTGNANPEKEIYNANFKVRRATADFPLLYNASGNLSLEHDNLRYTVNNEFFHLEGTATSLFDHPEFASSVRISHLPVMNYFGHSTDEVVVDGTGALRGTLESALLDGDFRLQARKQVSTKAKARVMVRDIMQKSRKFDAEAQLTDCVVRYSHPMSLKIHALSDSSSINAEVYDENGARLTVKTDLDTGDLSGIIDLDKFPLERIIDIFKSEDFRHVGKLTGKAEIGGTIKEPFFRTPQPIVITDLALAGVDRLSGTGNVFGKPGELTFSDLNLERDRIPIMQAYGTWVTGKPFVLDIRGNNVEFGTIGDIISSSRKCDGKTDYSFTMSFTRDSGTINGNFAFHNGHFLDIPFDEAKGVLGGGSDGFKVTDFTVMKEGIYTGKGRASSEYFWQDRTEASGLKMNLELQGDLLLALPYLTNAIKKASGTSQLNVEFGGTWQDPVIWDAELYVTKGTVWPAFLVNRATDVSAILKIDPEFTTVSGYKAVRILVGSGVINNKKLIVHNIHIGDSEWDKIKRPGLLSVVNNDVSLDFGIITGKLEGIKSRDRSISLHVPGFMKPKETGTFELSGDADGAFFVGASDDNGTLTPYISGNILARSGDFTYPLLEDEVSNGDSGFLNDIFWDLNINAGASVYYVNEINQKWGLVGTNVARILTKIDENSVFRVQGRISDGSFRVTSSAQSTSGSISYFGADFNIERVEFDLDTIREDKPAILTGRAVTVVQDSTGVSTEIYLNASTVDTKTDQRRHAMGRVEIQEDPLLDKTVRRTFDVEGLGTIEIEFTSTNPTDDTQEKILAKLGISPETLGNYTARALTNGLNTYYTNLWLRPFEDIVKRYTKIDVVRFTPSVLGNIVKSQLGFKDRFYPDSNYMLFDESRIMLGEYFFKEWFLSYQGQYGLSKDFLNRRERGFFHELDLQYSLKRNTRLQFKYLYDDVMKEGERIIEIRHDFEF